MVCGVVAHFVSVAARLLPAWQIFLPGGTAPGIDVKSTLQPVVVQTRQGVVQLAKGIVVEGQRDGALNSGGPKFGCAVHERPVKDRRERLERCPIRLDKGARLGVEH